MPQSTGDVAGQLSLLLAEGLAEGSLTVKVLECIYLTLKPKASASAPASA